MKKVLILIIMLVQAFLFKACDSTNSEKKNKDLETSTYLTNQSNVDLDAVKFLKGASLSSIMEVEFAKIAEQKAKNQSVKNFAEMIKTDYTKVFNEMKKLATEKKILLPIIMESTGTDSLKQLETLSGSAFDQNYMRLTISNHEASIKNFEQGADNRDAAVNKFAAGKIEILKSHLNSARSIYNSLDINRQ